MENTGLSGFSLHKTLVVVDSGVIVCLFLVQKQVGYEETESLSQVMAEAMGNLSCKEVVKDNIGNPTYNLPQPFFAPWIEPVFPPTLQC